MNDSIDVSVVVTIDDDSDIGRTVSSVSRQGGSASWELIVVQCGPALDYSLGKLRDSHAGCSIRVFRADSGDGLGAARNLALRHAIGAMITYVDGGDELYPGYLEHVKRLSKSSEVLIFAYDYTIKHKKGYNELASWDPTSSCPLLFMRNSRNPLGVAHRRRLWERIGGFDEGLWSGIDWDFLKRSARIGVDFLYLPFRSGLCHDPRGRDRRRELLYPTERQRSQAEVRAAEGFPIFGDPPAAAPRREVRKILFASPELFLDPLDSASIAARNTARLLACRGFACKVFWSQIKGSGAVVTRKT